MNDRLAIRAQVEHLLRQKGDSSGFADTDSLVASGRLESLDTLDLVVFLEQKYDVDFGDHGFDQNELDSVESILTLIDSLRPERK